MTNTNSQNTHNWTLSENGKSYEIPIKEATYGTNGLNIFRLYRDAHIFSYDPGFLNTASCETAITFIDGEKGVLLHRGYPVEELCEKKKFHEVAWLLLHDDLPNQEESDGFEKKLLNDGYLHEQVRNFFNGFRRDSHPMAMLCGTLSALSSFYGTEDLRRPYRTGDKVQDYESCVQILAKIPTLAAWVYRYANGLPFTYPRTDLDYAENFIQMLFSLPGKPWKPNKILSKAFDKILTLHADHDQNVSTSTVRMVGSTGVNPFACIASGIAALWGPAHGGANEAVLKMLNEIEKVENIPTYMARVRDKNDPTRLMGFGHRVYKNFDPRAKIMRNLCHEVLSELGKEKDPRFVLAMELEKIALQDDYFVQRSLYPNVDFYSGIIFSAMGIPTSLFTVIFAVARTAGWVAQWKEMVEDNMSILRPRSIYNGHQERHIL